jgi:hypothetical protein
MRYECPMGCVEERGMSKPAPVRCDTHSLPFLYTKALKRSAPLRRVSERKAQAARKRGSTLKQGRGFAASKAQREKVRGEPCVYCRRMESFAIGEGVLAVDPAHLVPKSLIPCDHALGVIPLCRSCHRAYDEEHLDILAQLEDQGYHAEMGHLISEHDVNPLTLLRYTTGTDYVPKEGPDDA